jgi:hypothetical protein
MSALGRECLETLQICNVRFLRVADIGADYSTWRYRPFPAIRRVLHQRPLTDL